MEHGPICRVLPMEAVEEWEEFHTKWENFVNHDGPVSLGFQWDHVLPTGNHRPLACVLLLRVPKQPKGFYKDCCFEAWEDFNPYTNKVIYYPNIDSPRKTRLQGSWSGDAYKLEIKFKWSGDEDREVTHILQTGLTRRSDGALRYFMMGDKIEGGVTHKLYMSLNAKLETLPDDYHAEHRDLTQGSMLPNPPRDSSEIPTLVRPQDNSWHPVQERALMQFLCSEHHDR